MAGIPGLPQPLSQQGAINPTPQNAYPWGQVSTAWRQFTGKGTTQETMAFGPGVTRAAFTVDIPFTYLDPVAGLICGYPSGFAPGGNIQRSLPVQHPNLYWMWAKNISQVQFGTPNAVLNSQLGAQVHYTGYPWARLTIEFWQPTYAITADGGITNEWERFVDWNIEPAGEFLTRPQGVFKWTAGGPQNGMTFNGQRNLYVPKKRIKAIWHQVPELGLFPSLKANVGDFHSTLLDQGVGCVNGATFMGLPAGTMLCEAWGCEPEFVPVNPSNMGGTIDLSWHTARVWNVFISLLHFDPQYGVNTSRGHNLFPQNDNLWWPIQAIGGANPPYPTYETRSGGPTMNSLFKMNAM